MYEATGNAWRTSDNEFKRFIKHEIEPLLSGDRLYSSALDNDGLNVNFDTEARIVALDSWREKLEDMVYGINEKIDSGETTKADNETALIWSQQILEKIGKKIEVLESGDLKGGNAFYAG